MFLVSVEHAFDELQVPSWQPNMFSRKSRQEMVHYAARRAGWEGWAKGAKEKHVLSWFTQLTSQLAGFAEAQQ